MTSQDTISTELISNLSQMNPKNQVASEYYTIGRRIVLIFLLMAASILAFTIGGYNYFMDRNVRTIVKCGIPVLFLIPTLGLYRSGKYHKYWKVSFAFLSVAIGFLLAWIFGGWYTWVPGLVADSVEGWALAKVAETLPIIVGILVLAKLSGDKPFDLFLKGGDHKKALGLGLLCIPLGFVQFAVIGGFTLNVGIDTIVAWGPWLAIFAFSNSLMEELIFRGLFLRKYEAIMGPKASLALISVVFAIFHIILLPFMGLGGVLVFVTFLFFESWLWGRTIQKSGSIWGAVLAHAIGDVLLMIAAFGT